MRDIPALDRDADDFARDVPLARDAGVKRDASP
jgi:hypothetical protein